MSQNPSSSETPPFRIFLSHAGEDKETIARPLWKLLREHGLSVFLDEESFPLSDHCPKVMEHAMATAPVGVFIMSPEFVAKEWPMRELLEFVRRYDRAMDPEHTPKQTAPTLIPIFYRLSTRECRDQTILYKYAKLFDQHGLFKRAIDGTISMRDVWHALDTAATLWSIRNDLNVTNESKPDMVSQRESFIQNVHNRILERLGIDTPQSVEKRHPMVENKRAQQDVYSACIMVPRNPPRLTLDYDSLETCEGRLRAAVLGRSGTRIVAVVATGKGGVGKTCAMKGLAEDSEVKDAFGGGILYIELGNMAAVRNIIEGIADIVEDTGGSKLANEIRTFECVRKACRKASRWFGERPCLFLVDDIWHLNGIDSDVLASLGLMVHANSRMIYTTRDRYFLDEAEETIEFEEKEALGKLSRQMLMTHAEFELNTALDNKNEVALEYFLRLCQGLPLGLGIVGGSVRRYSRHCSPRQDAWSAFYNDVLSQQKDLMETKVGSYGGLPRIVDSSLQVLEKRDGRGKFGYWFRALSVVQKQQTVPDRMLQRLWDLKTLQETRSVVESFADVSVVQVTIKAGSRYVKLHDLILDIAVWKCPNQSEMQTFYQTLMHNYIPSDGKKKRGECAPWWNADDDGYIHDNVCRILRNAGYSEQLLRLLSQPQWIVRRLVKDGIVSVEKDLDHGKAVCDENVSQLANRKEHLQMIGKAARMGASFVSSNPRVEEGWFQLHGRLLWHARQSELTSDFVKRMEQCAPKPWLKASEGLLQQAGGGALQRVVNVSGIVLCTAEERDAIWILSIEPMSGMYVGRYDRSNETYTKEELHGMGSDGPGLSFSSFVADQRSVVTVHIDGIIRVWNRKTGVCEEIVAHSCPHHCRYIGFLADGTQLACHLNDYSIRMWDTLSGKSLGEPLQGHTDAVFSVAMSADGTRIVSGSYDRTVRVWDAASGNAVGQPLRGHTGFVNCVAMSADGTRIVSGSCDRTVRVWDAASGNAVGQPLQGHTYTVFCVAMSADGTRIVSGAGDSTVRVWDAGNANAVRQPLQGHTGNVNCVAVSADGTRIVSGSADNTVQVWDAEKGKAVGQPLRGHTGDVSCVAVSADGTRIVSGSLDGTVRVWESQSGNPVRQPLRGHTGNVKCVAVSADGTRIVSASADNTVRVWDAESANPVGQPLRGHTGNVNCVAMSADGTRIVSGSRDSLVTRAAMSSNMTGNVSAGPEVKRLWALNDGEWKCVLTSHDAACERTINALDLLWSLSGEWWLSQFMRKVRVFTADGSQIVLGTCEEDVMRINIAHGLYFTKDFSRSCRVVS